MPPTNKASIQEAVPVLIAGAVGGICGVLASFLLKQSFPGGMVTACLAAPFLGALAAFAGIFLIANTDRTDRLRCLAFASICGFVWNPVLNAASALVTVRASRAAAEKDTGKLAGLNEQIASLMTSSPAEAAKKLEEASTLAMSAVTAAKYSDDAATVSALKEEFVKLVKSAETLGPHYTSKNLSELTSAVNSLEN